MDFPCSRRRASARSFSTQVESVYVYILSRLYTLKRLDLKCKIPERAHFLPPPFSCNPSNIFIFDSKLEIKSQKAKCLH